MEKRIKTLDIAMLLGAAAAILFAVFMDFTAQCEELQDTAFRLHILANSDSAFDQRVKYELRDYIIDELGYIFNEADSKDKAKLLATRNLKLITERANSFLEEKGCKYTAYCTVGKSGFGTRKYGDYTLPAGEYKAIRIILGNGKGQNWWCILYPQLCLTLADAPVPPSDESPSLPTRIFRHWLAVSF